MHASQTSALPRSSADAAPPPGSFAAILRRALGAAAWAGLHPDIAARFETKAGADPAQRFTGTVHWVYCSPVGAVIARLLRRAAILPHHCARDADFEFRIEPGRDELIKTRNYFLRPGRCFSFRSRLREQPALHEEFNGKLGMYLRLAVENGALLFRDDGYFLRLGRWRIPLPAWLTVGRFELLHRNLDPQRFQILIRVSHPLLGTLFYQRGEFQSAAA